MMHLLSIEKKNIACCYFICKHHAFCPKAGLFRPDELYMNSKGYDIWEKLIKEHM